MEYRSQLSRAHSVGNAPEALFSRHFHDSRLYLPIRDFQIAPKLLVILQDDGILLRRRNFVET